MNIEQVTFELEDVLVKLSELGLQKGKILGLVNTYINVHLIKFLFYFYFYVPELDFNTEFFFLIV